MAGTGPIIVPPLGDVVSAGGNTAGTLSLLANTTVLLAGGSNITLSQSGNTISIVGGSQPPSEFATLSQYEPWQFGANSSLSSLGQSSLYLQHMDVPDALQLNRMDRLVSLSLIAAVSGSSNHTGTRSNVWQYNETLGLFTRGTGTNSTNLYSFMSNSWSLAVTENINIQLTNATDVSVGASYTLGFVGNIDTNGGVTSSTFNSSTSSSSAGTTVSVPNPISGVTGILLGNMPFGSVLLSAGDYWYAQLGASAVSSGGTATTLASLSDAVLTNFNQDLARVGQTATANSNTLIPGNGAFTAQTAAFPISLPIGSISNNSNVSLYGNFMNLPM